MSEDVQKIEFDGFVDKNDWPSLEPFTEDKELGGFIDFGMTTLYAIPGSPKNHADPSQTWPPIRVKVTIERIMEKKPNAKKTA